MIEVEFVLDGLEYSAVLPYSYTWNELKERKFEFEGGWRVPYYDELIKLFDRVKEARDGAYIWSASANANDSGNAWLVDFNYGTYFSYLRDVSYGVRLVRELKDGN
jgi:hypothetical protein